MILGIQILGIIFSFFMIYFTFLHLKRKDFSLLESLIWFILWTNLLILTIFPRLINFVVKDVLSLSRPLDFFIISGFLVLIFLGFYNYSIAVKNKLVLENYLPHIGGLEIMFKNLTEGLVSSGHNVTVVTHKIKGTESFEIINGVKIHRVNSFQSRYLFTFFSIPKVMKLSKSSDIIHATTFNAAFPAWLASTMSKKIAVLSVLEVWVGKWRIFTDMGLFNSIIHDFLERSIY